MNGITHYSRTINGYKVVFINTKSTNVRVVSIIETGFIDEEEHTLGINHLGEHIRVSGNSICKSECIYYMNKNGIFMNASTGLNFVSYYASGLNEDLSIILQFIINTALDKNDISESIMIQEKTAVLNELLEASNSTTSILLDNMFKRLYRLYGLQNFYNYSQQIANLNTINSKELNEFFLKKYHNNSKKFFIIVGNVNENDVQTVFNEFPANIEMSAVKTDRNCTSNEKGLFFYENENMNNTVIITAFSNNDIKYNIYNNILLTILTTYLNIICMKILRGKEHLIYGINIESSFFCGIQVLITLNVSNENAHTVFYKFIDIIKDCQKTIDDEILEGIKKKIKFMKESNNEEEIVELYEYLYINKILNNTNDIIDFDKYTNMYLSVNTTDLKNIFNKIFDTNKILTLYSSQKSMNKTQ